MNDRELLEKAARGAGIEWQSYQEQYGEDCYPFHPPLWGLWMAPGWFNSINDNADALQLLLGIKADVYHGENEYGEPIITIQPPGLSLSESPFALADSVDDIRRAITRAAAALADEDNSHG